MYLCTIRCGDREGSQRYQPRKESGKFHKKNHSKRPHSQQENVATVPMSLKAFFPVTEGFSKTTVGGVGWEWEGWEKNAVLVWAGGVNPISAAGTGLCQNDAENSLVFWLLLSFAHPKSRIFLFCQWGGAKTGWGSRAGTVTLEREIPLHKTNVQCMNWAAPWVGHSGFRDRVWHLSEWWAIVCSPSYY